LGKVYVFDVPKNREDDKQNTINIGQRIGRDVSITVSEEEIVKLESLIIPMKYVFKRNEPLQIKVVYNNQDNISLKPSFQLIAKKNSNTFCLLKVIFNNCG